MFKTELTVLTPTLGPEAIRARRGVVGTAAAALLAVWADLFPTAVPALGISLDAASEVVVLLGLAVAIVYFGIDFAILAQADMRRHARRVAQEGVAEGLELLRTLQEEREAIDELRTESRTAVAGRESALAAFREQSAEQEARVEALGQSTRALETELSRLSNSDHAKASELIQVTEQLRALDTEMKEIRATEMTLKQALDILSGRPDTVTPLFEHADRRLTLLRQRYDTEEFRHSELVAKRRIQFQLGVALVMAVTALTAIAVQIVDTIH